jgi:glycine cleavage system H protein
VESSKWVGPFPTPLSGRLLAVNQLAFEDDIAVANRDPYGAGWMARIRPSELDVDRKFLVDGETAFEHYKAFIVENEIRCYRCAQ